MEAMSPTLRHATGAVTAAPADPYLNRARSDLMERWPLREKRVFEAADALRNNRADEAGRILSRFLAKRPHDPDALNLLAQMARQRGDLKEAEQYLAECARWSPEHTYYRYNYASVLAEAGKIGVGMPEVELLIEREPDNPLFRHLYGTYLVRANRYPEALACHQRCVEDYPDSAVFWLLYAQTLRSIGGRTDESIAAFRRTVALSPSTGTAWWSLASVKTFRFTEEDIRTMEAQFAQPATSATDRADLHYALGKAYDDIKNYEKAFHHYSRGNAIRRVGIDYDPDATTNMVTRAKAVFTREFFRERADFGCDSREPIFVLGLQRAGSTLLEQILGSHSQIEGAGELQSLVRVVADNVMPKSGPDYPNGMDRLTANDLAAFGERYLSLSNAHRHQDKPFFVDKCPYNLWHVGLIRLLLPKARIIDIRRHPIGCCYANFTMSFAHAPPLSYRLTDIGRFYADYVRLMAHFDKVMPGMVYRVIYEDLVADLEGEVRRLLDFLELPFEQACLEYYKTERSFSSYSNEQVRQPIFKEGTERWRNYEPFLGQLKTALGPVLDAYPGVPEFD